MEKNRETKLVAITSMLIAVVFLTIAYAVFSKSLNIQNISATVKANEANFSVKFSKSTTKVDASDIPPTFTGGAVGTGTNAKIDNSGTSPKLTNIGATFTSFANDTTGNGAVQYLIYAVNDGAFDAYLKSVKIANVTGYDKPVVCLPGEGTSKTLVDVACKSLRVTVYVRGANANSTGAYHHRGIAATVEGVKHGASVPYNSYEGNYTDITGYKLTKLNQDIYSSQWVYVIIGVDSNKEADAIAVDGPYSVKIGDVTLEYSTQD